MSSRPWDVRLRRLTWEPVPKNVSVRTRVRIMSLLGLPAAVWYFGWLLHRDQEQPEVVGPQQRGGGEDVERPVPHRPLADDPELRQ